MSTKVQIIKRLEIIKSAIELEDDDVVEIQVEKLKAENDPLLSKIINLIENEDYSKISEAIDDYIYGFKNAEMTTHQQNIFDEINKDIDYVLKSYEKNSDKSNGNNFLSLSGSAGVGKTFVTSKLIASFIKKDYKILLTTPTHKSLSVAKYMLSSNNVHVNSKTLQSYLDLKLEKDYSKGTKVFKRDKKQDLDDYEKNLDILIVDESSMISNELLEFIEENLYQNKLKSVLFIGDQYQLPPIDEGENGVTALPKQYQLTEIVRQAQDSYIKVIANKIKECIKNEEYTSFVNIFDNSKCPDLKIFYNEKEFLEDFTKKENWHKEKNIAVSYSNHDVDEQNRILRFKYWLEQGFSPVDAILVGEKLVFNESYLGKFMNSEMVTVSASAKNHDSFLEVDFWQCMDTTGRSFKVVDPDYKIQYNEKLLEIYTIAMDTDKNDAELRKKRWRHYFSTKETYADVKYIFASTIHKVQGSTYNTVYINAAPLVSKAHRNDQDMAYRLMYVAVTRASKDIKILF